MSKSRKRNLIVDAVQPAIDTVPGADREGAARETKSERVIKLLRRKNGATLADLQEVTGWQAHSVHGFLSGIIRKRMGLPLKSEVSARGERRYLIAGA